MRLFLIPLLCLGAFAQELGQPREAFATEDTPRHHARWRSYDLLHVRAELALDWSARAVHGRASLSLAPRLSGLEALSLDAVGFEVASLTLDDAPVAFTNDGEALTLRLPAPTRAGAVHRIEVEYRAVPRDGLFFVERLGADGSVRRMVHTQGQAIAHRHWLPLYDAPNDMTTTELIVHAPDGERVVSNGSLQDADPESGLPPLARDGQRRWHFVQEKPHVPYLITLVVGAMDALQAEGGGVPLLYLAPAGEGAALAGSFGRTPAMMAWFQEVLATPYPWEGGYTQVCALGYQGGGMENTGATTLHPYTLRDARALVDEDSDGLIAHELAHQWFGDLLTCAEWSHIWLNEGFADYFEVLWAASLDPAELAWGMDGEASWYHAEDAWEYRRPMVCPRYEHPDQLFDAVTYAKGAWVLYMLHTLLGDEDFFAGVQAYIAKHAHDTVTSDDLQAAMEEASGQALDWFFRQWLDGAGHPEYRVSHEYYAAQELVRLEVAQVQHLDAQTGLFRMPVTIELRAGALVERREVWLAEALEEIWIPFPVRPEMVLFDAEHKLLKQLDHPRSTAELCAQLAGDPAVLGRRDAGLLLCARLDEEPARSALARALRGDSDPQLRAALANELGGSLHGARWQFWRRDWEEREVAAAAPERLDWAATLFAELAASEDPALRAAGLRAMFGLRGPTVEAAALRACDDADSDHVRAAGLRVLARSGASGAADALWARRDESSHRQLTRRAVLQSLDELGDPRAFSLAADYLAPVHDEGLRRFALGVLMRWGAEDPQTEEILWTWLEDRDPLFLSAVLDSLGKVGGQRSATRLQDWLRRNREHALVDKAQAVARGLVER